MNTLWDSPKYKIFTQERNKALEQLNLNTQTDVSRMLFQSLDRITGFVSHMAIQDQMNVNHLNYLTSQLNSYIHQEFHSLSLQIQSRLMRMRKNTFLITYMAELEAIARATQKTKRMTSIDFYPKKEAQLKKDLIHGQTWSKRIFVVLNSLKLDILDSFQKAIARDLSPKEVVDQVKSAYPKIKGFKVPRRALKVLEADKKKPDEDDEEQEFEFYSDIVTQDEWDQAVNAYQDTELPPSRFDQEGAKLDPEAMTFQYDWELEQDMTDDFVSQVRDGQIDAATDLGVKDFVWVSIIDNKTCEYCCLPRNGLLVSEIESKLKSGELDPDECDATSPPAHNNCLPASSIIDIHYPIIKVFRRRYSNTMASLIMDDGRILQATANHPILTNRGWKTPNEIKIGDYLTSPFFKGFQIKDKNSKDMETSIQQIFDSVSFFTQITTRMQSTSDFHNDGTANQEVDIVLVNRELILNRISLFLKQQSDFFLKGANLSDFIGCNFDQSLFANISSSDSVMSFFSECEAFLFTHSGHTQDISLTSSSRSNSEFQKPFPDSTSIHTVFSSHTQFTHPILIILDRLLRNWQSPRLLSAVTSGNDLYSTSADVLAEIVRIMPDHLSSSGQSHPTLVKFNRVQDRFFTDFEGHVYNLETDINWYLAHNFIVHNCRCDLAPVDSTDEVEGPDWKSFNDWLNS